MRRAFALHAEKRQRLAQAVHADEGGQVVEVAAYFLLVRFVGLATMDWIFSGRIRRAPGPCCATAHWIGVGGGTKHGLCRGGLGCCLWVFLYLLMSQAPCSAAGAGAMPTRHQPMLVVSLPPQLQPVLPSGSSCSELFQHLGCRQCATLAARGGGYQRYAEQGLGQQGFLEPQRTVARRSWWSNRWRYAAERTWHCVSGS